MTPRRLMPLGRARLLALIFLLGSAPSLIVTASCNEGEAAAPVGNNAPLADTGTRDLDAGAVVDANCTQLPLPDGGKVHITGMVVQYEPDAATPRKPIPNAMISVEYGGLYLPWCDLSRASPYYVFGALTDNAGHFEMDVKEGQLGFHSFANDFYYDRGALDSTEAGTITLTMSPLPTNQAQPTVADAKFDKAVVAPGEDVTFSATLATWNSRDPLSDENVLVEPSRSWTIELHPPKVGKKDDFADGLWQRTFAAPDTPGTYTYWFSATTSQCVTSKLVTATLTVK